MAVGDTVTACLPRLLPTNLLTNTTTPTVCIHTAHMAQRYLILSLNRLRCFLLRGRQPPSLQERTLL